VTEAKLAQELSKARAARTRLEKRLASVGEALTRTTAELAQAKAELAELRGRHAVLAGEHRELTDQQQAAAIAASDGLVKVRWQRPPPDGGASIAGTRYESFHLAQAAGRELTSDLVRVGAEMDVPAGHAQVLADAGYVELVDAPPPAVGYVEVPGEVDAPLPAAG
jgi:hypothetical protein